MGSTEKYPILSKINYPEDLRKLKVFELKLLCTDIRNYLIDIVSKVGGHFGGGLGTVELTVALHKSFNTPHDYIVWDTGHQAYPHKIITGRKKEMKTIRQLHGLSGFLKRDESKYDAFGAGHASTSISAALGLAIGQSLQKSNRRVVAVMGDGAMTGGMAYEAMNNAGFHKADMTVILNDNRMSIAQNVWQFSNFFTEITSHPEYNKFKGVVWDMAGKMDEFGDRLRHIAGRVESGIKSVFTPGMLFEALGFRYFGPFNGHNVQQLVKIFDNIKDLKGPKIVHVITRKGKGYKPAENMAAKYHGVAPFDKVTGQLKKKSSAPSYTKIFGDALVEIAEQNEKVVGITAAMADGTGLIELQKKLPDRYIDVGIAEEHGVTFSAGLAAEGIIPVVAIYSTFMQRAYDQILHDIALQKLHVVLVMDRAGLVGADGPTHHGAFDLSFLRSIPDIVLMAPKDEQELRDMLYTAVEYKKGPIAIRYPRGSAIGIELRKEFTKLEIGRGEKLRDGDDVALLAVGSMVEYSKTAAQMLEGDDLNAEVINMRFVKPLDTALLDDIAKRHTKIVTLEENSIVGGFGSAVLEYFAEKNYKNDLLRIALPDKFVSHGTQKELHHLLDMDPEGIVRRVKEFCKSRDEIRKVLV